VSVPVALHRLVKKRADGRCEYCRMSQSFDPATFEIDHIIPQKMNGETTEANLALACFKCNNHKGPNIAAIDSATGEKVFLFDPRNFEWPEHFKWDGPFLQGITPEGRATVALLRINDGHRVSHRQQLITEGVFNQ